jgi:hypothetical protein
LKIQQAFLEPLSAIATKHLNEDGHLASLHCDLDGTTTALEAGHA